MLAYVSLWSADLLALGEAVDKVAAVADAFHIDVFDGHNAPELLFGPDVVAALRSRTDKLLDVHLNVTDPDYWLGRFVDAGADMVTVQGEASADIRATLNLVRARGAHPSLGLEVHEPPILGRGDPSPLLSGDVIAVEPGTVDPAVGGTRVEDLLLVTDDGSECLTGAFPYGLLP